MLTDCYPISSLQINHTGTQFKTKENAIPVCVTAVVIRIMWKWGYQTISTDERYFIFLFFWGEGLQVGKVGIILSITFRLMILSNDIMLWYSCETIIWKVWWYFLSSITTVRFCKHKSRFAISKPFRICTFCILKVSNIYSMSDTLR